MGQAKLCMLFHSISWACNQNQAVCSSQPARSIQLLLLLVNLLKLPKSVHWSRLHVAVQQRFCRDIKHTKILGRLCVYVGCVCVQPCGLARALPAPLPSQNIWESARTSAPGTGTGVKQRCSCNSLTATGSSGEREEHSCKEKCRLLFFHGVSHAAVFTVAFGMFSRWWFMDIFVFHKGLMFSVSPCLQGEKITCPVLCFPHLHFFIILSLQPIKWALISKSMGVEKLVCCIFISLKLFWSLWSDEKLETAKKKQPEKWGQVNPSHSPPWHHPNIFHFILFSNNNNRKRTFLSSYQVSFVNTQKGDFFFFF